MARIRTLNLWSEFIYMVMTKLQHILTVQQREGQVHVQGTQCLYWKINYSVMEFIAYLEKHMVISIICTIDTDIAICI